MGVFMVDNNGNCKKASAAFLVSLLCITVSASMAYAEDYVLSNINKELPIHMV